MQCRIVLAIDLSTLLLFALCLGVSTQQDPNSVDRKGFLNASATDMMNNVNPISTQGSENRIFNGKPSDLSKVPFMVGIRATAKGRNYCGGTLITSQIVLTAAHCMSDLVKNESGVFVVPMATKDIYVSIGSAAAGGNKSGERIGVTKVIVHLGYTKEDGDSVAKFDAGILLLREKVSKRYRNYVKFHPSHDNTEGRSRWLFMQADAYGWGADESAMHSDGTYTYSYPSQLQRARLVLQTLKTCQMRFDGTIPYMYICAGKAVRREYESPKKGICRGDSGGPLLFQEKQIGVVSRAHPMCGMSYGIFTRVSNIRAWIEHVKREVREKNKEQGV